MEILKSKRKSFVKMMRAINANNVDTLREMANSGFIPHALIDAVENTTDRKDLYKVIIARVKELRLEYKDLKIEESVEDRSDIIKDALYEFTDLPSYFGKSLHVDGNLEAKFEKRLETLAESKGMEPTIALLSYYKRIELLIDGKRIGNAKYILENILMRLTNIQNISKHIVNAPSVIKNTASGISATSNEGDIENISFDTFTTLLNTIDFEDYNEDSLLPLYKEIIFHLKTTHKLLFEIYIMESLSESVVEQIEIFLEDVNQYSEQAHNVVKHYKTEEELMVVALAEIRGLYK